MQNEKKKTKRKSSKVKNAEKCINKTKTKENKHVLHTQSSLYGRHVVSANV